MEIIYSPLQSNSLTHGLVSADFRITAKVPAMKKDEQHQFISSLPADILSMLCPGPRHTLYRFYWTLLKVPETQLTGKPSVQPLHPDSTHSSHPCERICYNPFLVSLSQQTSPDVNHRASDSCLDWHNCFKVNFRVAVRWAIWSSQRVR